MTDSERKIIQEFVSGRLSIMINRLNDNTRYLEVCEQQKKSEDEAEELLHKLDKPDRITIRRHYVRYGMSTGKVTNNVIKSIIRRSFGFRDMDNLIAMIYWCSSSMVDVAKSCRFNYKL